MYARRRDRIADDLAGRPCLAFQRGGECALRVGETIGEVHGKLGVVRQGLGHHKQGEIACFANYLAFVDVTDYFVALVTAARFVARRVAGGSERHFAADGVVARRLGVGSPRRARGSRGERARVIDAIYLDGSDGTGEHVSRRHNLDGCKYMLEIEAHGRRCRVGACGHQVMLLGHL